MRPFFSGNLSNNSKFDAQPHMPTNHDSLMGGFMTTSAFLFSLIILNPSRPLNPILYLIKYVITFWSSLVVVWTFTLLAPLIGNGPLWPRTVGEQADLCSYHGLDMIFLVNNLFINTTTDDMTVNVRNPSINP